MIRSKPIVAVLDKLFQHEEEVELPERCQEFFEKFNRERGEELQAYLARHQTMLKKLKEFQVDIPPLLAGWGCRGGPTSRLKQCAMVA